MVEEGEEGIYLDLHPQVEPEGPVEEGVGPILLMEVAELGDEGALQPLGVDQGA